jgi:hypothetical protein
MSRERSIEIITALNGLPGQKPRSDGQLLAAQTAYQTILEMGAAAFTDEALASIAAKQLAAEEEDANRHEV